MLKTRIMTAVILISALLGILFFVPPAGFCLIVTLLALFAGWEWTNLMGVKRTSVRILYLIILLFFLFNSMFIQISYIFSVGFAWWCLALLLIARYPNGSSWWTKRAFWRGCMGIMVIVPCWAAFNYIRNQSDGVYALLFVIGLIAGADSAAYFVGRKWGVHKLAPQVSPGKSIEGVIGALVFAAVLASVMLGLSKASWSVWPFAILLCVLTVAFSIVGDLFESMLKRNVGIKDSGNILPGHGGLLDRMDSLSAGLPVFAFGAAVLGAYLQ